MPDPLFGKIGWKRKEKMGKNVFFDQKSSTDESQRPVNSNTDVFFISSECHK